MELNNRQEALSIRTTDQKEFDAECQAIAQKLLSKPKSQEVQAEIIKIVEETLQAPVIKNYDFFMKVKKIINKHLVDSISQLNLPKRMQTMVIDYINYKPSAPTLKSYLNPEVFKTHQSKLEKEKKVSIELFADQPLTTADGLEYALNYILYVCGGSENINDLIFNEKLITITIDDISKIV